MSVIEGNRILAARARELARQAGPGTLARKATGAAARVAARQVLVMTDQCKEPSGPLVQQRVRHRLMSKISR